MVCYHLCCIIFSWLDHFIAHFFLFFFFPYLTASSYMIISCYYCVFWCVFWLIGLIAKFWCHKYEFVKNYVILPYLKVFVLLCVQAWHSRWAWVVVRRLACTTRPWSTATNHRALTRLLTSSLSYVKRPRALRIKYTPFVSHTPCVLSHIHLVSCLTHILCHVSQTPCVLSYILCLVSSPPCVLSCTHPVLCLTPILCLAKHILCFASCTTCVLSCTHPVSCVTHTSVSCLTNLVCCLLSTLCVWTHTFCVLFRTHCVCVIHTSCLVSHPPCVLSHTYTHTLSLSLSLCCLAFFSICSVHYLRELVSDWNRHTRKVWSREGKSCAHGWMNR